METQIQPQSAVVSRFVLAGLVVCAASTAVQAQTPQVAVSGFGSIVAGGVVDGDGYIANYTQLGIYGKNGSAGVFGPKDLGYLNPESRFGLQGTVTLDEATRVTLQAVARGTKDYEPKIEWAYLTRELASNLNAQVGKMRLPVYLHSDKMDVGFAYPWLRVPADTYSLDAVTFTGAKLNHDFTQGELSQRTSLWAGTDNSTPNQLMSYLFSTPINRENKFVGLVSDTGYGPWQFRVSYTVNDMKQTTPDPANAFRNETFANTFLDVALQYQIGDLTLIGEWNKDKPFYTSYFVSGVYQMGVNSVYLTYSKFTLDEPWEKHPTVSLGLRRDIGSNMAFKVDATRMTDEGLNPFSGKPNPVIKIAPGHATVLSVGLDFIF